MSGQDRVLLRASAGADDQWLSFVELSLSRGVTPVGTAACFADAAIIALAWAALSRAACACVCCEVAVVAIAGFAGGLVDSVLGATVQAHDFDQKRQRLTEREMRDVSSCCS
jgi:uncharacterized membrane protein